MKRTFGVPLIVLIAVAVIPFQTSAQPDVYLAINECYKHLFNLHKDMLAIGKYGNKNRTIDIDSLEAISEVADVLDHCEEHLSHVLDLLQIKYVIVTNTNERKQISDLIHLQSGSLAAKDFDLQIDRINSQIARTKNQSIVSLFSQSKVEIRKVQELLIHIE